jgi:hypothetical protein
MLIFTLIFAILAIAVLFTKGPARAPYGSIEYRIDNRVVASVLMLMAIGFAVLAWSSGKYF